MLRLLSLTRNIIPYIRELRELPLVKSIASALLMQQLDYWFERSPNGFYKFLAPCDNEYYKAGDSWVEELGFSKDEFRTAFDNLGIRYTSKSQFLKAINPFLDSKGEQKYYCSYIDKIKGVTYYIRNHLFTDKSLKDLLDKPNSKKEDPNLQNQGTPTSVNRETQSLSIKNSDFPKSEIPIPILYTEITSEITPEITPERGSAHTRTREAMPDQEAGFVEIEVYLSQQQPPIPEQKPILVSTLSTNQNSQAIACLPPTENDSQHQYSTAVLKMVKTWEEKGIFPKNMMEINQWATEEIGNYLRLYRKSGHLMSSSPSDIDSDFVSFVAKRWKGKDMDAALSRIHKLEYSQREWSPREWSTLKMLVDEWQASKITGDRSLNISERYESAVTPKTRIQLQTEEKIKQYREQRNA